MPYFVDLAKASNVKCIFDETVELKKTDDNIVCVAPTLAAALVFSIVAGVYTITNAQLTAAFFTAGDRVIIRGSVSGDTPPVNNDGVYTIVTNPEGSVTVLEPVKAATSVLTTKAGGLGIDEYATFILHPEKHSGKMVIWLNAVAALAGFDVSLVPGGFWYSKAEVGLPTYQGSGVASKKYLLQIEIAKYLQLEEGTLAVDGTPENNIQKQGTVLVRVFPGVIGDPLLVDEIEVTYIALA